MLRATRDDFDRFVEHARALVPGFSVHDGKKNSYWMNAVDGIIWPFNPKFMERYITTLVGSVFYPEGRIDKSPLAAMEIAGHELVHAYDAKRLTPLLFSALYLSFVSLFCVSLVLIGILISWVAFIPFGSLITHLAAVRISFGVRRITGFPLLVLSLLATIGLMVYLSGWSALWLAGACVFLAPLPAFGRAWAEFRGYGMSIYLEILLYGKTDSYLRKVRQFTGPPYYFMWPFPKRVERRLRQYESDARSGKLDSDPVFKHVRAFFDDLQTRSP